MKIRLTAYLLLFATVVIVSCKRKNVDPPQKPKEDSLIVRIQQGIIPGYDAVFLLSYDVDKRIKKIVDSVLPFTLTPTYNSAGDIISIKGIGQGYSNTVTFSYNTDNQLTQVDAQYGQNAHQYVFEYVNGVISKRSVYNQARPGVPGLELFGYYTYEVTNGNITKLKQYNKANALVIEKTFTYTSHPNISKPLALLNWGDRIGLGQVANEETFFNKNLIANYTSQGSLTTFTYTYNSNQRLSKFIIKSQYGADSTMLSY